MARISYIGDNAEPLEMVVGEENPEVMVGRHRSCGIRTATQSVSRQHARIFFDGERYWLQDNGSSNGTYYKNNRLSPQDPVEVEDGEFFMCGNFEMRFDLDEEDLQRMQAPSQGYEDTMDGELDYGEDSVEATRFAEAGEWEDEALPIPPPPPPPAMDEPIPPPPAADMGSPIPPPPGDAYDDLPDEIDAPDFDDVPAFDPLPLEMEGGGDARVIEELRADLEQRDAQIDLKDSKIQNLEIELESLSKRLVDTGADEKVSAMNVELEKLRPLVSEVEHLREEFEKACEDADNARDDADKVLADLDELKTEAEDARRAEAEAKEAAAQALAEVEGLREELANAPAAEVDEEALDELRDELRDAVEDLGHVQEKYEEARAGRRNAEELAALLRTQYEMGMESRKALEAQIVALKSAASVAPVEASGDQVPKAELELQVAALAQAREEGQALQTRVDELVSKLAAASAQLLEAPSSPAAVEGGAEALAEVSALRAEIASLEAKLASQQVEIASLQATAEQEAQAHATALAAAQAQAQGSTGPDLSVDLAQRDAQIADLQAELAEAVGGVDPDEIIRLNNEIEVLEADRDDLERAQSANMKRIKKLLKDLDELRSVLENGPSQEEVDGLRAQLDELRVELGEAQRGQDEARSGSSDGGMDLGRLTRLVSELNGAISTFRSDFIQVTDAWEQLQSDDEVDRVEGGELMQEGLDTCTGRAAELKRLVRSLRDAVRS